MALDGGMARITLDHAGITFKVRRSGRVTLKEFMVRQLFRRSRNPVLEIRALDDICLDLTRGTRLGIIGHNGAGKSTLLKLLAGVYPPTSGARAVSGRISSLFDITLGFEPEATGWENVSYRAFLQGETPSSLRPKLHAIAEFSELGDFLNVPVRCYSSGMLMRLAFSIATAMEPEILLVDEVLSVGDMAFQEKARQRMQEMLERAHLIVMVSHDLDSLAKVCDQALLLDHGRIRMQGPTAEVIRAYETANNAKTIRAA